MSEHGQVEMTEIRYGKDRPEAEHRLMVEDISLRDGHQSLFATRGRTEDMISMVLFTYFKSRNLQFFL